MSRTWSIAGISKERPRVGDFDEYNGEDVYSPVQPTRGQINECLLQFTGKPILLVVIGPTGCETVEEVAQEVKDSVVFALECRSGDDPVLKVLRGEKQ